MLTMLKDGCDLVSPGQGDHIIHMDYKPDNEHLNQSKNRIHHVSLPKSIVPGGADWRNTIFDSVTHIHTPAYGSAVCISQTASSKLRSTKYSVNTIL